MTQRKTYSRSSSTYNRTSSAKKSLQKKYGYTPKKSPSQPPRKGPSQPPRKGPGQPPRKPKRQNANIIWVILVLVLVVAGILVGAKINALYADNTICSGITIDGIDVSGMTYENALSTITQHTQQKLDTISINLHYEDKTWSFDKSSLNATTNLQEVLDGIIKLGHEGSLSERMSTQKEISTQGRAFKTDITIDETVLTRALDEIKSGIDNPMVEGHIEFDPSSYDFFEDKANPDVDMSRSMFNIVPGKVGYSIDYEGTKAQIEEALKSGYQADITITAQQMNPTITEQELQECTTLVYHSDSEISTKNRKDAGRNHNLAKALGYYKGLVVKPGDIVSYNDLLGFRDKRNGWQLATTIAQDKSYKKDYGGGICQVATAIFNAAYMAGAEIIEHGPHSFRAYSDDYGYAMDSMVNYGTSDLVFTNNTDYPMFFNTYMFIYSDGLPLYVDVDVYTMPQKDEQGNILHIRAESQQIDTQPPTEGPEYIPYTEDMTTIKPKWETDTTLNQQVYVHIKPRNLYKYEVYRVWYKDSVQTSLGEWDGGVEVKRERSHTYTYNSVRGKIYTRPIPVAPVAPQPPSDGGVAG